MSLAASPYGFLALRALYHAHSRLSSSYLSTFRLQAQRKRHYSMSHGFSEDDAVRKFDKLVALGLISYGPSTTRQLTDKTYPFKFRICPSWATTPNTVDEKSTDDINQEMFGPNSDIVKSHPDQVVGNINDTHILALNAFPVFRPQYLLLNNDSCRSQNEPLDLQDIAASLSFLKSVTDPHYLFYNCTKFAGCSRYHKHLQIIKKPEAAESSLNSLKFFPDARVPGVHVPYRYFLHYFNATASLESNSLYRLYLSLLTQCRRALGIDEEDSSKVCPHNMVLTKDWMILIPRRSNDYGGVGANAAA